MDSDDSTPNPLWRNLFYDVLSVTFMQRQWWTLQWRLGQRSVNTADYVTITTTATMTWRVTAVPELDHCRYDVTVAASRGTTSAVASPWPAANAKAGTPPAAIDAARRESACALPAFEEPAARPKWEPGPGTGRAADRGIILRRSSITYQTTLTSRSWISVAEQWICQSIRSTLAWEKRT